MYERFKNEVQTNWNWISTKANCVSATDFQPLSDLEKFKADCFKVLTFVKSKITSKSNQMKSLNFQIMKNG